MARKAAFDCRAQCTFRRTIRFGYWVESSGRFIVRDQTTIQFCSDCGPGARGKLSKKRPVHKYSQTTGLISWRSDRMLHCANFVHLLTQLLKLGSIQFVKDNVGPTLRPRIPSPRFWKSRRDV
jgi:hypothetical protein